MTLSQIAEKSGVSIGTVDRVVNNRGKVAPATKQKIEEVIEKYGYTPNLAARQLKQRSVLTVGVLFPLRDTDFGYWDLVISGIQSACLTLRPFTIELLPAFFDRTKPGTMLEAGAALLEKGVDGMILSPVLSQDAQSLAALMNGAPYIYVDSPLAKTRPLVTIAQSPFRGGLCAGRMMSFLKRAGLFAAIRMFSDGLNLRERIRGFSEYFGSRENSRTIEVSCDFLDPNSLHEFMDELFALHPDISGIFVPHAEGYLVAEYLVERGLKKNIALIGYDNLPRNRRCVLDGAIDCLISQRADNQGYQALCELYRHCVLGEPCEPVIDIPIDVFFRENI
ncbi:MAG: LacI family DNA-binding transcriptional regulator [Spirochaetaceae bacterium]|jgi:LacI family transcriptional regulator|nr:LacI family DNA-binding transcriptional regulator [Spirochaetaceae bacterium]